MLRGMMLTALLSSALVGCAAKDPMSRVGACVAAISNGAVPIGQKGACDLGRRTYLVALPRHTERSDLKELGLPEQVILSLTASPLGGSSWCSVTTEAGELPGHDSQSSTARDDAYRMECVESSLEIESAALVVAEAIRIHVKKADDGTLRVTGVQGVRQ